MQFQIARDIKTDELDQQKKTFLAAMAHCVNERKEIILSRMHLRSLVTDLNRQERSLATRADLPQTESKELDDVRSFLKGTRAQLRSDIEMAEDKLRDLSRYTSRNFRRYGELNHMMAENGMHDWTNRAFFVDVRGHNSDFDKTDDDRPGEVFVDVNRLAEQLEKDLKAHLPEGTDVDNVCDIVIMKPQVKKDANYPRTVIGVTFNSAHSDLMRKAIAGITEKYQEEVYVKASEGRVADENLAERVQAGKVDRKVIPKTDGDAFEREMPYTFTGNGQSLSYDLMTTNHKMPIAMDASFMVQYPLIDVDPEDLRKRDMNLMDQQAYHELSQRRLVDFYRSAKVDDSLDITSCLEELDKRLDRKERKERHKLEQSGASLPGM